MEANQILLTLTAEQDSSKLDRNPWVMNGLNCLEPDASWQHSSQSLAETSEIEETTETDMFFTFSKLFTFSWHISKWKHVSICKIQNKAPYSSTFRMPSEGKTFELDSFNAKFPSSRATPEGSAAFFLGCQKRARILNVESEFRKCWLDDEFRYTNRISNHFCHQMSLTEHIIIILW